MISFYLLIFYFLKRVIGALACHSLDVSISFRTREKSARNKDQDFPLWSWTLTPLSSLTFISSQDQLNVWKKALFWIAQLTAESPCTVVGLEKPFGVCSHLCICKVSWWSESPPGVSSALGSAARRWCQGRSPSPFSEGKCCLLGGSFWNWSLASMRDFTMQIF